MGDAKTEAKALEHLGFADGRGSCARLEMLGRNRQGRLRGRALYSVSLPPWAVQAFCVSILKPRPAQSFWPLHWWL